MVSEVRPHVVVSGADRRALHLKLGFTWLRWALGVLVEWPDDHPLPRGGQPVRCEDDGDVNPLSGR